jgi:hypothetical protein
MPTARGPGGPGPVRPARGRTLPAGARRQGVLVVFGVLAAGVLAAGALDAGVLGVAAGADPLSVVDVVDDSEAVDVDDPADDFELPERLSVL